MLIFDEDRPSDSPFVERVWRCHSEGTDPFLSIAGSHCELVVSNFAGEISVTMRGPETRATVMGDCPGEGEWFGIILKLGTFLPLLPPSKLINTGIHLPLVSKRSFSFSGFTWQLPDYHNAETFVEWLVRRDLLIRDPLVDITSHDPGKGYDPRTIQRRFSRATGLTQRTVQQIERARYATLLLRQGTSILDTVERAGYFDQPHLTRALKHFVGQTPAQIREGSQPEQMSFLYKTAAF